MLKLSINGLRSAACATVILIPAASFSFPRDPLVRRYDVSHLDVVSPGDGFSVFSLQPRTGVSCVEFEGDTSPPSTGQKVALSLEEITDNSQLSNFLDVSASARLNASFGSASASAKFVNSLEVNSYDYFIAVRAIVTNTGTAIKEVRLKQPYLDLLRSGHRNATASFRRVCGDGFVGAVVTGGSFDAVVQIHTKSVDQRKEVATKIDIKALSGSGSAAFSQKLSDISKTNKVSVWTYQQGGLGSRAVFDVDKIKERVEELPNLAKQNTGVPFKALIYSYAAIVSDPDVPVSDFLEAEGELVTLAALYDRAARNKADYQYVLSNPDQFHLVGADLIRVLSYVKQIEIFQETIERAALVCLQQRLADVCSATALAVPEPVVSPARKGS